MELLTSIAGQIIAVNFSANHPCFQKDLFHFQYQFIFLPVNIQQPLSPFNVLNTKSFMTGLPKLFKPGTGSLFLTLLGA